MGQTAQPRRGEGAPAAGPHGPPVDAVHDGIRETYVQLLTLQLRFRRHMQESLSVDSAGLTTMTHLARVGSDTPTAIARTLGTSTAATSLVLNRLEASGHISRQPHPTDRRKVVVVPAPASIASANESVNPVREGIDRLTAALTPVERSTVAGFLQGLVHVLNEALRDGK